MTSKLWTNEKGRLVLLHIKLPINNGLRMERNDFIASPLLLGEIIFGYFLAKRNETNDKKQT